MDPELQKIIEDLQRDVENVKSQMATHYHGGAESTVISWSNIYQRLLYVPHTIYGTGAATSTNYSTFFIAPAACLLVGFKEVHATAGTDAGTVTLDLEKLTGTTAPGSGGRAILSALSLKATANTVQTATMIPPGTPSPTSFTNRTLAAGDCLALKLTGTPTSVANVTTLTVLQLI